MADLAHWLRFYIQQRLHSDPGFEGIRVILSDASVPGEGEHKIMEHIRRQRALPGYEADTRHARPAAARMQVLTTAPSLPN
jgi:5'-3' exoribonuclease 2